MKHELIFTMKMKIFIIVLLACVHLSTSFMTLQDLDSRPDLQDCYNVRYGTIQNMGNREDYQPLSNSMETFISLIEKLESSNSMPKAADIILKLLTSYRIDDIPDDFKTWGSKALYINEYEKNFFNIPEKTPTIYFKDELTDNERCALHFMLSHSVNYTATSGSTEELTENGNTKRPRESGVVSLNGKEKHAFALDRVLMGILAGLSGNNQVIPTKLCDGKCDPINKLYSLTLGDLISIHISQRRKDNKFIYDILPNGIWNDLSCPTEYVLEEVRSKWYLTNSLIRGAVDGLIIGNKLLNNQDFYRAIPLSQILRMYYGPSGLLDANDMKSGARSGTHWCSRDRLLNEIPNLQEEILNFHRLYTARLKSTLSPETANEISETITVIKTTPETFVDISNEGGVCGGTVDSAADRCTTPFDIFAVLDWQTTENFKNFQTEIIGNLSASLDVRPKGNSVGVYRNARLTLTGLEVMANNSGLSGCSACFIKYNTRTPSRIGEIEVFEKLNQTLTDFEEVKDNDQNLLNEAKSGSPGKVILYFNYGNTAEDYKLGEVVWEVKRSFPESTVLAIGSRRDSLKLFTSNDDTDIFTESSNAVMFLQKLKSRICKVPAEFQYKDCQRRSTLSGTESTQEAVIGLNKKQYWAMYPKYFLKSFYITLKFKAQDGARIRVCFNRHYYRIIEENNLGCQEAGDELTFTLSNPCHRRSEYNCDPFYFLIEGKQVGSTACNSPKCSTPRDIQFEFTHDGISCSGASFVSISTLTLLFAGLIFLLQRH